MHDDIRATSWLKAQTVTAGLLLLPLGARGLISLTTSFLFGGFQVSPQMSYQPLWLLTWDSRAYPIPYFCNLMRQPPRNPGLRAACLVCAEDQPTLVLWVHGLEKECVQTTQPTVDAAQVRAVTVARVRFPSQKIRL